MESCNAESEVAVNLGVNKQDNKTTKPTPECEQAGITVFEQNSFSFWKYFSKKASSCFWKKLLFSLFLF